MAQEQPKSNSTKDLKRVLKRGDLMGIAVGQIVGAGVMVMSISALNMTGRSVNIAFVIASILTIIGAVPSIFFGSVVRLRGGTYTQ
ncbi:MAG: amino acid transporter, partial [Oscillospiraceae bacterium]